MKLLQDLINDLEGYGLKSSLIQPGLPQIKSDLAMPCFQLAKEQSESPQVIAHNIAKKIKHPEILKAEAINGYVNLWISSEYLARLLWRISSNSLNLGEKEIGTKTILIEYFSPNIAKPPSVGHLRNLFQGRALTNLYKIRGWRVITDNHIGDWGTIFGLWVVGFLKYGNKKALKQNGLNELGKIYVAINKDLKKEEQENKTDLQNQIQAWFLKLEQNDQEAWQYHKLFTKISYRELEPLLDELNVKFDENLAESFYYQFIPNLLEDLKKRRLIEEQADGSLVADLKSQGIKIPLLIQKSNGGTLYSTRDIATLHYRQKTWDLSKIIYVVGIEQKFYLKQLFVFNKMANICQSELIHHSYGLVEEVRDGKRQKMSSRKQAIHLQDVLQIACKKAEQLNQKSELSVSDIKKIAYGALAFQEFSQSSQRNFLFDWDRIFNPSEISGPYVQYATLRLKAILDKTQLNNFQPYITEYDWQPEHALLLKLLHFEDILEDACQTLEINKITTHILEITQELNRYYEENRILDEVIMVQSSRLWFINILYRHLVFALNILGIQLPAKM
ncbi:MAG: arginine--tRNA ligase [Candidatus Saccharibacteria bacterium]|nr:arginine--tRNA ligase [Candidatus Saccharibacteria bacterium]